VIVFQVYQSTELPGKLQLTFHGALVPGTLVTGTHDWKIIGVIVATRKTSLLVAMAHARMAKDPGWRARDMLDKW